MSKRIIICSDGTWNRPETKKDDKIYPTNANQGLDINKSLLI